jgi:predicted nuclease of restriction endonuclease-like (RecB) superfamily
VSAKLQDVDYDDSGILWTVSAKSLEDMAKGGVLQKIEEKDNDLLLPSELLLTRLSFSHFIELLRVDDALQRLFYEVEAIKSNWSVRELKRAIGTSLAFRTTMSTNKEAVIRKIKNLKPVTNAEIIRNPFVLEFLDLEEKSEYSETELETRILNHLQEFLIELGIGFCFEAR